MRFRVKKNKNSKMFFFEPIVVKDGAEMAAADWLR